MWLKLCVQQVSPPVCLFGVSFSTLLPRDLCRDINQLKQQLREQRFNMNIVGEHGDIKVVEILWRVVVCRDVERQWLQFPECSKFINFRSLAT